MCATKLKDSFERDLLNAVDLCRAGVLATFELELGDHPNWKPIRSRLLRCFGDRGLEGRISEIMSAGKKAEVDHE